MSEAGRGPVETPPGVEAEERSRLAAEERSRLEPGTGLEVWACDDCLRRTWLLTRLAGHLVHHCARIDEVLALEDLVLINKVGGKRKTPILLEYGDFGSADAGNARRKAAALGLGLICACDPAYPKRLHDLNAPPAVLHVAGGVDRFLRLCAQDPVAVVGSRSASPYGTGIAADLARGAAAAGLTVVSGMAAGADTAAHKGALSAGGGTIAVLPGSAHEPVPAANRGLHAQIISGGAVVSELPPGAPVRNWSYLARNRIIAALCEVAVVVQAAAESGSLKTIEYAQLMGRCIAAVPGAVGHPMSVGPNMLLAHRKAEFVTAPQDLLDLVARTNGSPRWLAPIDLRPPLTPLQEAVLSAISRGHDTVDAIALARVPADGALAELAALELNGWVRRGPGGRYTAVR